MTGNYLADTNVWVRLLRNDAQTARRFSQLSNVAFRGHVLGELYLGAYRSQRVHGEIKQQLFSQGTPLPENDMWIAATALRHNLTLITYDAHFDAMPHLTKERW